MPGRPKATARRARELEQAVLNVFCQLDGIMPDIHKETEPRHGASAQISPWVPAYQIGCEFLLAVDELGRHFRKAAGITEPGPIRQTLTPDQLKLLRQKYQRGSGDRSFEEIARCREAALQVSDDLPAFSDAVEDFLWAMNNQHVPCPDFPAAPSRLAIGFWFALASSGPTFKRTMYSIFWNKQLRNGDWSAGTKPTAYKEDEVCDTEFGSLEELLGTAMTDLKAVI